MNEENLREKLDWNKGKSVTEYINHFLETLPLMTQYDADILAGILTWDNDKKAGFMLAKSLFEDQE